MGLKVAAGGWERVDKEPEALLGMEDTTDLDKQGGKTLWELRKD